MAKKDGEAKPGPAAGAAGRWTGGADGRMPGRRVEGRAEMRLVRGTGTALAVALLAAGGAAAQPVAESGPAVVQAESADDNLQWAASVSGIEALRAEPESSRLFGVSGGDPAMNGLYTYLAFFVDLDEGWRVFRVGDFLDYRVVAQRAGRLLLDIRENVMDREGVIGTRRRRLAISWTRGPDGAPPARVTVQAVPRR